MDEPCIIYVSAVITATRSDPEGLELCQGDDVVVTVEFGAFGTHRVVEVDFALGIHGRNPLGSVLERSFKNFGQVFATHRDIFQPIDFFGDGQVMLGLPGREVIGEHKVL